MSRKRKIIFFIPSKVQILDLTGPVQVFYEANSYGAEYDLQFVSIHKQPDERRRFAIWPNKSLFKSRIKTGRLYFHSGRGNGLFEIGII